MNDLERAAAAWAWELVARREQIAPRGDWSIWLVKAGRGWGKTRVGAEWVRSMAQPGARIALVGPTAADVRDVMIEGESGLLSVCEPWNRPVYEPSKRRVTWANGAMATAYSAEEPDRLRGPQHTHAWTDEVAAWPRPEAWDMLMMGLRLGEHPQVVATTTPRNVPIMRAIQSSPGLIVTRGRTLDNAGNLAPSFLTGLMARYEGTRLGRQELEGEDLDDNPDALWQREGLDHRRVREAPGLARVVVAIDPAATSKDSSDETGIVVAALGTDGRGYVLADRSGRFKPDAWASVGPWRPITSSRLTASWPKATRAARWLNTCWERSRRACRFGSFTRRAARSHGLSPSLHCTSRGGSRTWVRCPNWKTSCARGLLGPGALIGLMPWCGRSLN
jgi:phage terminase large subunit-like protein